MSDTSPLSGLAITGHLFLLKKIYGQVVIPIAVADELRRGGQDDTRINEVLALNWIEVRKATNQSLVESLRADRNLDWGEAEAIALVWQMEGDRE